MQVRRSTGWALGHSPRHPGPRSRRDRLRLDRPIGFKPHRRQRLYPCQSRYQPRHPLHGHHPTPPVEATLRGHRLRSRPPNRPRPSQYTAELRSRPAQRGRRVLGPRDQSSPPRCRKLDHPPWRVPNRHPGRPGRSLATPSGYVKGTPPSRESVAGRCVCMNDRSVPETSGPVLDARGAVSLLQVSTKRVLKLARMGGLQGGR